LERNKSPQHQIIIQYTRNEMFVTCVVLIVIRQWQFANFKNAFSYFLSYWRCHLVWFMRVWVCRALVLVIWSFVDWHIDAPSVLLRKQ